MEMRAELVISAPAEDAWVVVGERFGEIAEWASAITESITDGPPAVGRVRTCQVAGFGPIAAGVIKERLIEFDPEAGALSYEAAAGLPWFIAGALSRWSVHAGPGSACTVRIHAALALRRAARPLSPALRWRMRADTRRVLAELRHQVEARHPDPATLAPTASGEIPLAPGLSRARTRFARSGTGQPGTGKVLRGHEPYPAWVIRQPFTIIRANTGAEVLFPGLTQLTPDQLIDLWYGPGPFQDQVVNWPDVVQAGLAALRHTAADTGDSEVIRLLARAEAHLRDRPARPEMHAGSSPVVCPVFEFGGQVVRTISTVMRFDTAIEVTTSQLRIELMSPADDAAEAYFQTHQLT